MKAEAKSWMRFLGWLLALALLFFAVYYFAQRKFEREVLEGNVFHREGRAERTE